MEGTYFMKRKSFMLGMTLFFAISVILFSFSLVGKSLAAGESSDQPTKRTVNVSGQGTIKASPDIAYVTVGVITEHADAKTAQQNNAKAMGDVVNQIKNSGVKSEDIKTVNFSIYPRSDYNQKTGVSKIVGYTVNNLVQVTVRDMTSVGNILDIASANGANVANNISFGLSDYEKYYNQALKDAVTKAKVRAGTMAEALGISLKTPVTVTENGGYSPPAYNYGMYDMKASAASPQTPVEAGDLEIKASVNLTYEY